MNMLATYIHNLDPVIFEIPGTALAIRWYGLAYVAGFVLGYLLLRHLSARKLYCVENDKLGDFVTNVCIFGVLIGGRLGEFFFYWLPENGWNGLCADPTWVFRVWEGGMASHGGIIAVILTALWYARKHAQSFCAVLDGLAIASPIGLFCGRVANFINGELYGRATSADNPIGMKFPTELLEMSPESQYLARAVAENHLGQSITSLSWESERYYDTLFRLLHENEGLREQVGQLLTPRYPSQLFEAAGEGLLIFLVLVTVRLKWKNAPAGIFCGLFGVLYAAARITCECFKQPGEETWGMITRGQYLSFGIAAIGVAFLIIAWRNAKNAKNLKKD